MSEVMEGVTTAYRLWYPTSGVVDEEDNPGRVDLLHTMTQLSTRIGHLPTQWDNRAFASKRAVVDGMITVADWD